MDSISHNQIWQLTKLPLKNRPITIEWIYKVENNSINKPSKYKVRLVVEKRFEQREGLDF
jgi:hypothetical protein